MAPFPSTVVIGITYFLLVFRESFQIMGQHQTFRPNSSGSSDNERGLFVVVPITMFLGKHLSEKAKLLTNSHNGLL